MRTPLSTASTIRLLAFAAVLATGCSSNTDNGGNNSATCQACATAGNSATASGGRTSIASGGTSTTLEGGGTSPTGGAASASGGASVTGSGGTVNTATGGTATANTGGSLSTAAGGVGTAGAIGTVPTRCSTVTGTVAKALVTAGATLLDVRTASEYASNGLPGAINIPVTELATRLSELDISKNIVVYCASGTRSGQANTQLCAAGYNVFNLGPLTNWPQ